MTGHRCWECGRTIRPADRVTSHLEEAHDKSYELVFSHVDCDKAMLELCSVVLPALSLMLRVRERVMVHRVMRAESRVA